MNDLEKTFTVTKTLYECVKQFTVLQWHMCYDFMNTILNIFQKKNIQNNIKDQSGKQGPWCGPGRKTFMLNFEPTKCVWGQQLWFCLCGWKCVSTIGKLDLAHNSIFDGIFWVARHVRLSHAYRCMKLQPKCLKICGSFDPFLTQWHLSSEPETNSYIKWQPHPCTSVSVTN